LNASFDARWRRKALAGDAKAVDALASAMLEPLYRFCLYRLGRDEHLCEDVVQETLVRALRQLSQYDPARGGGDIFGWLSGLARNEIRRALSQRNSAASLEALWGRVDQELLRLYGQLDSQPYGPELLARQETREMVNAAMSQLPPQYSQALAAKYVLGRSVREIAKAARTSEKAVESQLSRAREAFRTVFLSLSKSLSADPTI
jgi:RNA polymerase sigma-70 factor (ECF subfamily)